MLRRNSGGQGKVLSSIVHGRGPLFPKCQQTVQLPSRDSFLVAFDDTPMQGRTGQADLKLLATGTLPDMTAKAIRPQTCALVLAGASGRHHRRGRLYRLPAPRLGKNPVVGCQQMWRGMIPAQALQHPRPPSLSHSCALFRVIDQPGQFRREIDRIVGIGIK